MNRNNFVVAAVSISDDSSTVGTPYLNSDGLDLSFRLDECGENTRIELYVTNYAGVDVHMGHMVPVRRFKVSDIKKGYFGLRNRRCPLKVVYIKNLIDYLFVEEFVHPELILLDGGRVSFYVNFPTPDRLTWRGALFQKAKLLVNEDYFRQHSMVSINEAKKNDGVSIPFLDWINVISK